MQILRGMMLLIVCLGIENSYRWCGFNIEVNPDILPSGNYNVKLVLETAGKIYDTGQQLENINIK